MPPKNLITFCWHSSKETIIMTKCLRQFVTHSILLLTILPLFFFKQSTFTVLSYQQGAREMLLRFESKRHCVCFYVLLPEGLRICFRELSCSCTHVCVSLSRAQSLWEGNKSNRAKSRPQNKFFHSNILLLDSLHNSALNACVYSPSFGLLCISHIQVVKVNCCSGKLSTVNISDFNKTSEMVVKLNLLKWIISFDMSKSVAAWQYVTHRRHSYKM